MTSNERKILEYMRNHGGEVHAHFISSELGFSSDYSHSLCRALKKAGHLEFSGRNFCRLSRKGHKYFQDHDNIGIIATSSLPLEELTDDTASSDKDDKFSEEEKIEEIIEGDPKLESDAEAQQADYPSSGAELTTGHSVADEKQNEDKDEEKTDSSPPAGDGGATVETEENAPRNDAKHDEKETEKPTANLTSNIGLMIKKLVGLFKGSIQTSASGHAAQGTKHQ